MRNTVAGIAIALILVAALFVVMRYSGHTARQAVGESASDPAQAAARIKDGFVGDANIGDWKLSCVPPQEPPKSPGAHAHTARNAHGKSSKDTESEWKIPRCRLYLEQRIQTGTNDTIRITVRRAGLTRALTFFLRFPPKIVAPGDSVNLRLDKTNWAMTVSTCADNLCLVRESIRKDEAHEILGAKAMVLTFTVRTTGKRIAVPVSTTGLDQALATMVRVDR